MEDPIIPLEFDPEAEPQFTIKASELCTPTILNMAIYYYKLHGASKEKIAELLTLANKMEEWRNSNSDKIFIMGVEHGEENESHNG